MQVCACPRVYGHMCWEVGSLSCSPGGNTLLKEPKCPFLLFSSHKMSQALYKSCLTKCFSGWQDFPRESGPAIAVASFIVYKKIRTAFMLVSPIIKSRKHTRHKSMFQFSLSRQCPFQNGMLEFLGLSRADDLILLLFCVQRIFCLAYTCHKSRLKTLHTAEAGHMNGQGMHKAIFAQRRRSQCHGFCRCPLPLSPETSVGLHSVYSCWGRSRHGGLKHCINILLLLSAPMDQLEIKLNWSLVSTKHKNPLKFGSDYTPYMAILYNRVTSFARPGQQRRTANMEHLGRKFEIHQMAKILLQ